MSTIIRVKKDQSGYVVIRNEPLNDNRLSWGARGILAYLLSKPDDWRVISKDLYRQSPAGRAAVDKMLGELKNFGYLHRQRFQDEQGHWGWVSTVYENPASNPNYQSDQSDLNNRPAKNDEKPPRKRLTRTLKIRQSENPTIGKPDSRKTCDIQITDSQIPDSQITEGSEDLGHTPPPKISELPVVSGGLPEQSKDNQQSDLPKMFVAELEQQLERKLTKVERLSVVGVANGSGNFEQWQDSIQAAILNSRDGLAPVQRILEVYTLGRGSYDLFRFLKWGDSVNPNAIPPHLQHLL